MVIVSKKTATNKNGDVKKGYRRVEAANGRIMYLTDNSGNKKKPVKKVKSKGKVVKKKDCKKVYFENDDGTMTTEKTCLIQPVA